MKSTQEVILNTESTLSAWFSASMLLLANALIFFHMARVHSIEVPQSSAALIAVLLISAGVAVLLWSVCTYAVRIYKTKLPKEAAHEAVIGKTALGLFVFIIIIFILISWIIGRRSIPALRKL